MNRYLERSAILIERYYLETFILEITVLLLIAPSIRSVWTILVGVPLTLLVSISMKLEVRESRPKNLVEKSLYERSPFIIRRSFPSIHSAVSFIIAAAFFGSIVFLPAIAFAIFVMYSRVYIHAHHPIDVVAGALVGAGVWLITLYIVQLI